MISITCLGAPRNSHASTCSLSVPARNVLLLLILIASPAAASASATASTAVVRVGWGEGAIPVELLLAGKGLGHHTVRGCDEGLLRVHRGGRKLLLLLLLPRTTILVRTRAIGVVLT